MSSPQPSSTAAEDQQQGQAALAAAMVAALAGAWALLDVQRLADTLPGFTDAVRALIHKYGQASAAAALRHYQAQRVAAGVPGRVTVQMPPAVAVDAVTAAVQGATQGLWRPPADQVGVFVPDVPGAQSVLDGMAERLVLNQGRAAVLDTVDRDREAKGWARVPHPDETLSGTCAFCLLLATRGAVYKTKDTATFRAHYGCHCTAEPQFSTHYEPTATVRAAQALYAESTADVSGMKAKQLAFRRAVEGRKAPAEPQPSAHADPKTPTVSPAAAHALIGRLEKSLTTMRANNKNGSLDKAITAAETRIASLRDALSVAA